MTYPQQFLSRSNFILAFERIVRGGNKEYKQFYRHIYPSYNLSLQENLDDLIHDIKSGTYKPSKPTIVFQPKKTLILRPLALLSLTDLIVYQAITNYIANKFESEQATYAFSRSFGAIYAGKDSPFFYRSWKVCYSAYNKAIEKVFNAGNTFVADFDLVSFYELIDHNLLREKLLEKIKNVEILDLLFECLERWTIDAAGSHIHHGIPQGPEPSAFLAECFLFHFDTKRFKDVKYFRYVDDIKLMAKSDIPLRRALLHLDLSSKELGLVPQAQKIELRETTCLEEVLKNIPSSLVIHIEENIDNKLSQHKLLNMLRKSTKRVNKQMVIDDATKFKYSLVRIDPRKDVLKKITPLLARRPDLSGIFASYFKKFPNNKLAADILLETLKTDPIYDAAAANYIDAMDICEPNNNQYPYRRVIQTANRRSVEKSILIKIASHVYTGRRVGAKDAAKIIEKDAHPIICSILIHRLFGDSDSAPYKIGYIKPLLEQKSYEKDADLARYCASLLLLNFSGNELKGWKPRSKTHRSVKLLMFGLGLRSRTPKKTTVLDSFFKDRMKIGISISWRKALGRDWRDAERRCLRLQKLFVGDPTARIMMLDTFNELLLQCFSQKHKQLTSHYSKAAGNKPHPDLGAWLDDPKLATALPKGIQWFKELHSNRVKADLAHAKMKGGKRKGKPTKPISYKKADNLIKRAKIAWAELILEWRKII